MPRQKPTLDLTHDPAILRSTREISVGAYARRARRWRLVLTLCGLALIGGAAWLYAALRRFDLGEGSGGHPLVVECVKCGYRGTVAVAATGGDFPLECPKCHERACHKLWQCRDCGQQFLNKAGGPVLECLRCGSGRVGSAEVAAATAERARSDSPETDANGR